MVTVLHAIAGATVGAFTALVAAAENASSPGWQILIFVIGIALGAVCVLAADWQLRRQHEHDTDGQRPEAGRDA